MTSGVSEADRRAALKAGAPVSEEALLEALDDFTEEELEEYILRAEAENGDEDE